MKRLILVVLYSAISSVTYGIGMAQQVAIPSNTKEVNGPSLEETIHFIDETYQQQPPLVSHVSDTTYTTSEVHAEADGPCSLTTTRREEGGRYRYRIALDKADAMSLAVASRGGDLAGFQVTFNGIGTEQPLPTQETPTPLKPESFVGDKDNYLRGIILNINSNELVFVSDEGKPFSVRLADVRQNDVYHFFKSERQDGDEVENRDVAHFIPLERIKLHKITNLIGHGKQAKELPSFDVTSYPIPAGLRTLAIPPVASEDTANHLAKALVHAIALCHPSANKPLF